MADDSYKVVHAPTIEELERAVRIEMLSDWQPVGGVAVDQDFLYQAMIPKGDD